MSDSSGTCSCHPEPESGVEIGMALALILGILIGGCSMYAARTVKIERHALTHTLQLGYNPAAG